MKCVIYLIKLLFAVPISAQATAADDALSQWSKTVGRAVSADFIIYPAQQESRSALDVASLLGWGTHRTIRLGEKRWSTMLDLLAALPDRPSPRPYFEARFGIVFLSRTGPIGALFCRNPYAVAPSEIAVDCLIGDDVKIVPLETVRALVAVAFTTAER